MGCDVTNLRVQIQGLLHENSKVMASYFGHEIQKDGRGNDLLRFNLQQRLLVEAFQYARCIWRFHNGSLGKLRSNGLCNKNVA